MKNLMALFSRHKTSKIFLIIYAIWWLFLMTYFSTNGNTEYPSSCGLAYGTIVMFTLFITFIYTLLLVIQIIKSKEQKRLDYLVFLNITLSPVFATIIYLIFL